MQGKVERKICGLEVGGKSMAENVNLSKRMTVIENGE